MEYKTTKIKYVKLPHYPDTPENLKYATEGSACFDICAAIDKPVTLKPNERFAFPTGFKMAPEYPLWLRFNGRSGLATKHGIIPIGGIIDTDYRGEPLVTLVNIGTQSYTISPKDKIAQAELPFPYRAVFIEIDEKEFEQLMTKRGSGSFGSTGK